jgi:ribonucleoside-triphosphate reductase
VTITPADHAPTWGPTGETVFRRTYSRTKAEGDKETWHDTVLRTITGNLGLVYGEPSTWSEAVQAEAQELYDGIYDFRMIPAGRQLYASGVKGRQYLFNCHVSGWGEKLSTHFDFTFMRLMEGGGVGANYSTKFVSKYGAPKRELRLHIVADSDHKDYDVLQPITSTEFSSEWQGAFQIEDSREGWAAALVDLIDTFYSDDVAHKDRVYDVSQVRPKGSKLKRFGGTASGPLPLAILLQTVTDTLNSVYLSGGNVRPLDAMNMDHAIADCVVSGGVRRSARMAICRWDDPDIETFITAKQNGGHWTTNMSVEIDDEFIEYIQNPDVDAYFNANKDKFTWANFDRHYLANKVHGFVVEGMLNNGEPGYWNSDLSNQGEIVRVHATNPCGEIALDEWENCNLGHINLERFVDIAGQIDFKSLHRAHELMTRFLIRSTEGDVNDEKQAFKLDRNRRIGVGHIGVQGHLNKRGIKYSEAPGSNFEWELQQMYKTVRQAARDYAFELRIPEPIKVTAIAPTGSISKLCGATEGIHPIYAKYFIRRVRFSMLNADEATQVEEFKAQGYHVEPDLFAKNTAVVEFPTMERLVAEVVEMGYSEDIVESVDEIPLKKMLAFQAMYQTNFADNAVSFTVNMEEGAYSQSYVEKTMAEYLPYLKGTTLMIDGSYQQAPYERLSKEQYQHVAGLGSIDDSYDEACASGACPVR